MAWLQIYGVIGRQGFYPGKCRAFIGNYCHSMADHVKIATGFYKVGCLDQALQLVEQMDSQEKKSISLAYVRLLQECGERRALIDGKLVHRHVLRLGFESNSFVANTLVSMYTRCDSLVDAFAVFVNMPSRSLISWNALIAGYARQGNYNSAFMLLKQMGMEGLKPDNRTFVSLLVACAKSGALKHGKQIHSEFVKAGYHSDVFVANALVDMYIKCHSLTDAREAFDKMPKRDVISYTTMIGGYIKNGDNQAALEFYQRMKQEGLKADGLTFVYVLNACANTFALEHGKQIHAEILEAGCFSDIFVGNSLINLYAKCGSLIQAHKVLMAMPRRDVVSWTTIIAGSVKHRKYEEAIALCQSMKQEGLKLDKVTFVSLLNACANIAALEQGKQVHIEILDAGIETDIFVSNALIDMYGKGGSLKDARAVFNEMPERDTVSWTAIIASYTMHGDGAEAFHLFRLMQYYNVEPDEVTFVSVLTGCSHVGLLDEGCSLFESMYSEYKLTPMLEHYGCMIDLFGRSGRLLEAYNYLLTMPLSPDVKLWKSLLGACKVHGNLELAESVIKHILQLQPQESAAYVMLSNIYAASGEWQEKVSIRQSMDKRQVSKVPAHSISGK